MCAKDQQVDGTADHCYDEVRRYDIGQNHIMSKEQGTYCQRLPQKCSHFVVHVLSFVGIAVRHLLTIYVLMHAHLQ